MLYLTVVWLGSLAACIFLQHQVEGREVGDEPQLRLYVRKEAEVIFKTSRT